MTRSRRVLTRVVQLGLWIVLVTALASAAAVRGRLERNSPNGRVPAGGIQVTLSSRSGGGRSAPVRSGQDGLYYLQAPPGAYLLEIWTNPDPQAAPTVYPIQVKEPLTDIPPIIVP